MVATCVDREMARRPKVIVLLASDMITTAVNDKFLRKRNTADHPILLRRFA
jgi:hypothetical protein